MRRGGDALVTALPAWFVAVAALICVAGGCRSQPGGGSPSLPAVSSHQPTATTDARDRPAPVLARGNSAAAAPEVKRLPDSATAPPAVQLASFQPREVPTNQDVQDLPLPKTPAPANAGGHQDEHIPAGATVITLAELEQMAMVNNPTLPEARARVEAARGRWVQVGLYPNTVLGYSGQQLGSGGQAEQQGLLVEQEFIGGRKLLLNRSVVAQEIRRAESEWAAQQMRVLTDVRLCFYDVLVAQRQLQVVQQLVQIAQEAEKTADALFRAQEVSRVDVTRATIELNRTQLREKVARNDLRAAWLRLEAVLGVRQLPTCWVTGDLEAFDGELCIDAVLSRIIDESPLLAAAAANVQRARWAIDRAYAEPVPNVEVQAVVQNDNATGSANANLQITLPIPWLNRNQGGIRQAQAELVVAQRAVNRVQQALRWQLATVYQRYANARNQVEDYSRDDGILDNSAAALELIRRSYAAGESTYLNLLEAQRDNAEVNLDYVNALGNLWAALIEVDGLLLKGSLESLELDDFESAP